VAVRRDLRSGTENETALVKEIEPHASYGFPITGDLNTRFLAVVPEKRSPDHLARIYRCDLWTGQTSEWMRSTNFIGAFPTPDSRGIAVLEARTFWEREIRLFSNALKKT